MNDEIGKAARRSDGGARSTRGMPPGGSGLVRVSAALASRDEAKQREALTVAARELPAREVEEVLLQSYLFLGFPAALNGFAIWREVSGLAPPQPTDDDLMLWVQRGRSVCERVYGGSYPDLRRNIAALHPDMDRWMVAEGYGKVLARDALSLELRELCIVGLLAVLEAPVQLYSHIRGCLLLGLTPLAVSEALEVSGEFMGRERLERARGVFSRVTDRKL